MRKILKAVKTAASGVSKTALRSFIVGLCLLVPAALALSITGRESSQQRSIFQVGIAAASTDPAITASTTQTLVGAYQLTAGVSTVTTANSGDAVKLPSVTTLNSPSNLDASLNIIVLNNTSNSISVFPFASTDVIAVGGTPGSAGAAFTLLTQKQLDCWSVSSGRWYCTAG